VSGLAPLLAVEDGVARITLRRPRQANRLTVDDLATLRGFITDVNANDAVRVLVLAGEGKHFCSGFDLGALVAVDAGARFGELADALEAAALLGCGYLDQLLPDVATLDAALEALTAELLAMAPLSLLPMKQHLNAIAAGRLDDKQLAADIERARDSADLAEGQAAWAGKRTARFKGC